MVSIHYTAHCVTRGIKAMGHAVWLGFQQYGYTMTIGYNPDAGGEESPVERDYERNHSS